MVCGLWSLVMLCYHRDMLFRRHGDKDGVVKGCYGNKDGVVKGCYGDKNGVEQGKNAVVQGEDIVKGAHSNPLYNNDVV